MQQNIINIPNVPIGSINSFGAFGSKYKVGNPIRQLEDGDWIIEITLIETGEKTEYSLAHLTNDPKAY